MKADFTRFTFDPGNHYSQVLKQQGRPDLDADWNEQGRIANHLLREALGSTIGQTGFPKDGSFKVDLSPDASTLLITPGRAYVDGILARLEARNGEAMVSYNDQPDFVKLPPLVRPQGTQTDLVYLDVWERHVTAAEEPLILERALGGIDPTTRLRIMAQVRIQPNVGATDCAAALGKIVRRPGGGRLSTVPPPANAQPDSWKPENHLYRVEIHDGGGFGTATFKWSRDNGAIVFPIKSIDGQTVTVEHLGRDQRLTIHDNHWVEIISDETELQGLPGMLAKVVHVDPQDCTLTFGPEADLSARKNETGLRVRRWDMVDGLRRIDDNKEIKLEPGIQIQFSLEPGGAFYSGDYWLFTLRTTSPYVQPLKDAPPHGIEHHYAALAMITWKGTQTNVVDCRQKLAFPPLTAITASDVSYDDVTGGPSRDLPDVQQALDALFRRQGCAAVVEQLPGWEERFRDLCKQGGRICFLPGVYDLSKTLTIEVGGPLVITGAGEATIIRVASAECAFHFVLGPKLQPGSARIVVRDLAACALSTRRRDGIRGVFDFETSSTVCVENVVLTCADGPRRAAACLSIHGADAANWEARVRGCRLSVGVGQNGIVIINPSRVWITDNTIEGTRKAVQSVPDFLRDRVGRSLLRRQLISKVFVKQPAPSAVKPNVIIARKSPVTAPGRKPPPPLLQFVTSPSFVSAWNELLAAVPPKEEWRPRTMKRQIERIADDLLRRNDVPAFQAIINRLRAAIIGSAYGIVIGGARAGEVWIDRNYIIAFVQGIHLGLSKQGPRTAANAQRAGRVQVSSNSIRLWIGPDAARERHGIFVGNADDITIEDNSLNLDRAAEAKGVSVEGIRAFGYLGRHVDIRNNHITGFDVEATTTRL